MYGTEITTERITKPAYKGRVIRSTKKTPRKTLRDHRARAAATRAILGQVQS